MVRCNPQSAGLGVVSVDWFALQCKLGSDTIPSVLRLPLGLSSIAMAPTAVWSDRFFIMDDRGNKVATLLMRPRSKQIPPDSVQVEIANRWLYYDDFLTVANTVLDCAPLSPYGLNRVDLCCDFEMSLHMWKAWVALYRGEAYVKALRSGLQWWQTLGKHRVCHCMNWGGKESLFTWKVYYKYLELQQAAPESKKPYITEMWRKAGFDPANVWRCEVSIHGSNLVRRNDNSKVSVWDWYTHRTELFSDLYHDKFVVRMDEGHKDRRNDTVLPFLCIEGAKTLRHSLPETSRDDSDPERRVICKLWKELNQTDTQLNPFLTNSLLQAFCDLVQSDSNAWAVRRQFGVDNSDIDALICRLSQATHADTPTPKGGV